MLRTAVHFGLISGALSFALFLFLYFVGVNPLGNYSMFGVIIPPFFIVIGMIDYKNQELGGYMKYGQGLGLGMLLSVIAGLVNAILVYLICTLYDTHLVSMNIEENLINLEKSQQFMSQNLYDMAVEAVEKLDAANVALGIIQSKVIGGLLVSLILAAFIRKEEPMFD